MGWSAGRHVDHPCGGEISPWPARKVTELCNPNILHGKGIGIFLCVY